MTEQELLSLLSKHDYAHCWDELKPTLVREIQLTVNATKHDDSRVGCSKQGGKPDLSPFEKWPKYKIRNSPDVRNTSKPMTFLMQLNCSDIRPLTSCSMFPETGLLSFFVGVEYNQLVWDTNEIPLGQVVYSHCSPFELERTEFPRRLYYQNQLPPAGLKMEQSVSVSEEILLELLERHDQDSLDWINTVRTFFHREIQGQQCHKMFGYSTVLESNVLEECSHLTRETDSFFSRRSDWILLLEFDLEELNIHDSGFLSFLIHREDLNMMNFQNTICFHNSFDPQEFL